MTFNYHTTNQWQFCSSLKQIEEGENDPPYINNYWLLVEEPSKLKAQLTTFLNLELAELAVKLVNPQVAQLSIGDDLKTLAGVDLAGKGWELCKAPAAMISRPLLVTFDMDSTLICEEVIDEIARDANCYEQVSAITEAAMRGELDFSQSLKNRVECLAGLPQSQLQQIADRLTFSPGAKKLLTQLHQWGIKTAILSGGFDFFAKQIAVKLEIPIIYSNRLEIHHGKLTGQVLEPIIDAKAKAFHLRQISNEFAIPLSRTLAVGDGANDLLVLSKAALGIAWHAKPAVATKADLAINSLGLDAIGWIWQ